MGGGDLRQACSDLPGGATLLLRRIEDLPAETAPLLTALLDGRAGLRVLSTTWAAPAALDLPRPLFHRLAGAILTLPPLRQRQDIGWLLDRILRRRTSQDMRLSPSARAALLGRPWPGNLRELEQVLDVAIALCEGRVIDLPDLPVPVDRARPGDVLLFRWRADMPAKHAGVLVAPARFVHAYDGSAVVESPLGPWWRRRLAAAFAFPGVIDDPIEDRVPSVSDPE